MGWVKLRMRLDHNLQIRLEHFKSGHDSVNTLQSCVEREGAVMIPPRPLPVSQADEVNLTNETTAMFL